MSFNCLVSDSLSKYTEDKVSCYKKAAIEVENFITKRK